MVRGAFLHDCLSKLAEVSRLYPPAPLYGRKALDDDVIFVDGHEYPVPKDVRLSCFENTPI